MNISLKKVISSFLAMSLGVASIGSTALITSAEDTTSQGKGFSARDATVRELTVDFMGRETPTATSPPEGARLQAQDVNHTFWVGVAVNNADSLPLFKEGVFSIELSFEYDPDFLVPDSWDTKLSPTNIQAGAAVDNQLLWSDLYRIISVEKTDIDYTENRENKELGATRHNDGWKMCTVCITKDNSAGDRRFQNLTSADKQYLIRLPFILKRVPADTEDQNPIVLSLIRGPGTLDIGSGVNGENEHSASWEALSSTPTQEELDDQTNLRNLFSYPKDISLFGSASELENLVVSKTELKEGEDPVDYTLSKIKNDEQEEGFETATKEYYLSVPYETEKIKLTMISSEKPQVSNGSPITVTSGENAKEYVTDAITLDTIDKTVEEYGYNNVITITIGTNEYKIHIRRYLQPKIELEYGNSPFGEIMKSNIVNKEEAKEKFYSAHPLYGTWLEGYTPESMLDNIGSRYAVRAWTEIANTDHLSDEEKIILADDNYNMDRNDKAIFVFNGQYFKEPGYTAVNSYGETVDVQRYIEVNRMLDTQINGLMDNQQWTDKITIGTEESPKSSDYVYTEITKPYNIADIQTDEDKKTKGRIRPDIYYMKYWFDDPEAGEISVTRPVIVLQNRGDGLMQDLITNASANPVFIYLKTRSTFDGLTGTARQIYLYRSVNLDGTSLITNSDVNKIYQYLKIYKPAVDKGEAVKNPLQNIYKELPND